MIHALASTFTMLGAMVYNWCAPASSSSRGVTTRIWRRLMKHIVGRVGPWEYYCRKVAIQHPSKCWNWMQSCGGLGYGNWALGGIQGAHRATYRLFYGEPSGMILHKCGNRKCCNPNHLYNGTSQQNRRDAEVHGTAPLGSRHGQSKLTEAQVLAIRADSRLHRIIASEYGVSRPTVSTIKSAKAWAWLQ